MTTTLQDIHDNVRTSLGRGTSLNTSIVSQVERAALFIERNHTYSYMERLSEFLVDISATQPRVIALPNRVKQIMMIRWTDEDDNFRYLTRVNAEDVSAATVAPPEPVGYWLDGTRNIVLDSVPGENRIYEVQWAGFTEWPVDLTATNWLIENGGDSLEYQTLLQFAGQLRDERLLGFFTPLRDEAFKTLLDSDSELRFTDRDVVMLFAGGRSS